MPDTSENVDHCICTGCPSFPGEGILYCARGTSEKPVKKRGCVCPSCKNYRAYGLKSAYYCADGSAEKIG